MTIKKFIRFLQNSGIKWNFIVPCNCGDINCKGWRVVTSIPQRDTQKLIH